MPSAPLLLQQRPRGPLNALHLAARAGSTERTVAVLSRRFYDIDQQDPEGATPFMFAADEVLRILLINKKGGRRVFRGR